MRLPHGAVAVLASAAALALPACGGDSDGGAAKPKEIRIDRAALEMLVAEGSLWRPGMSQVLERRDLETGGVVATIRLPDAVNYVDAGEGRIWVAGNHSVTPIDPATNRPSEAIALGSEEPGALNTRDVAAGFGRVWVADFDREHLRVFDAETGEEEKPPIRTGEGPTEVEIAQGAVWVGNVNSDSITRIDPETRATREIRLSEPFYADLAAGEDGVFVGYTDGSVVPLDPRTGRAGAAMKALPELEDSTVGVAALGLGDSSLWVLPEIGGDVIELDARTRVPIGEPVELRPEGDPLPAVGSVAAGERTVWIAATAELCRDPETDEARYVGDEPCPPDRVERRSFLYRLER